MAVVRIPDENRCLHEVEQIREFLAGIDIDYQHWEPEASVPHDASADQILSAYEKQINELKYHGGYVTADVIDVNGDTPGLDVMLAKFNIDRQLLNGFLNQPNREHVSRGQLQPVALVMNEDRLHTP